MAPPGAGSKTLRDLFDGDLDEEMVYESDTELVVLNGSHLAIITDEDNNSRAPSPFLERSAADTLTALRTSPDIASTAEVNTTPLDEQQQQLAPSEERAKRRSETGQRGYVSRAPSDEERLKEAGGRSLSGWFIGPETTSPSRATFTTMRNVSKSLEVTS